MPLFCSVGCRIHINVTGTSFKLTPGIICGGTVFHDCGTSRSIGWFVEGILPLLLLGKESSTIKFSGITNDAWDLSVDTLQYVTIPLLRKIGIQDLSLKISRRGAVPNGGGLIEFTCSVCKEIFPIKFIDSGLIKKIHGVAYSSRTSSKILVRAVESARKTLNSFLSDVHIRLDSYAGPAAGFSAGYGLSLFAESTSGFIISAERTSEPRELPEEVGAESAYLLLDEIGRGGVVDSSHQVLILQLMIMASEDVSKVFQNITFLNDHILFLLLIKLRRN